MSQSITKVTGVYLGTLNMCTKYHPIAVILFFLKNKNVKFLVRLDEKLWNHQSQRDSYSGDPECPCKIYGKSNSCKEFSVMTKVADQQTDNKNSV